MQMEKRYYVNKEKLCILFREGWVYLGHVRLMGVLVIG